MRVLIDYRPALRERTGVGEYVHQLVRALARSGNSGARAAANPAHPHNAGGPTHDEIVVFSSSWKDRLGGADVSDLADVRTIDLRWPVALLNFSWHRLGWPAIELLTGERFDVAHSPHPLLIPSLNAARVVTIHDLHFLAKPAHATAEIRRDYGILARAHARRADRVVVPSAYTAGLVHTQLDVPDDRISVCPEGVPDWVAPPTDVRAGRPRGFVLFLGTLEARKNVGGLLSAYTKVLAANPGAPTLVLAGKVPPEAGPLLMAIREAPLAGHVECLGYVPPASRQALYEDAGLLVLPSFDEGFGLPAVEAMSLGVPVVVSNRGSLPEVVGDAGLFVEPDDPDSIAAAIARIQADPALAAALSARGKERARMFSWQRCAALTREAYELAIAARNERRGPRRAAAGG